MARLQDIVEAVQACTPVAMIAQRFDIKIKSVKNAISRARKAGLLPPVRASRPSVRRKWFDEKVYQAILPLLKGGERRKVIARTFGLTLDRVGQYRTAAGRRGDMPIGTGRVDGEAGCEAVRPRRLGSHTLDATLRPYAAARCVGVDELKIMILSVAGQSELVDAILDDGITTPKGGAA